MEDGRQSLSWLKWGADCTLFYFFKNGPTPASFLFIFGLLQANIITIFTTNIREKMSIQYTVLGFEPTTFWNVSLFP